MRRAAPGPLPLTPDDRADGEGWWHGCPSRHLPIHVGAAGLSAHRETVHSRAGGAQRPVTIRLDFELWLSPGTAAVFGGFVGYPGPIPTRRRREWGITSMGSVLRAQAWFGQRALLLTTVAVPLTGWTVHAIALRRRLAAAQKDPLTGLLRRDAYTARARQILARHGDNVAVILVDADHFKDINDTLGHPAGDTVLAAYGARLTAWAGRSASVGRLGGDEFAVVLPMSRERREARLATLVRMLHTPVVLDDGCRVDVAASVGAATPDVTGTRELSALQRAADAALYDGKHSGRVHLATREHASVPSINGRRAGRPGTGAGGWAA